MFLKKRVNSLGSGAYGQNVHIRETKRINRGGKEGDEERQKEKE